LIMVCKSSDRANTIEGIGPPPEIPPQEVLGRIGYSDFWEDPDGILRRQVLLITPEESSPCAAPYAFSTQLAMHYLTAQGIQPTFNDRNLQLGTVVFPRLQPHTGGYRGLDAQGNQLLVNYRATEAIAPQISLSQLLAGQVDPDMIKDRIVLIGVIDPNAGDIWSTPYGTGAAQRMPGVHVQAHMTSQLISAVLDQRPILWTWGEAGDGLWIGLWSTMGGFLVWSLGGGSRSVQQWVPRLGLAIGLAVGLLYGICLGGLIRGAWLPLVPSVLGLFTTSSIMVISLTAHSFKQIEP
jgi:CHASE2 domain-containing sensor protein